MVAIVSPELEQGMGGDEDDDHFWQWADPDVAEWGRGATASELAPQTSKCVRSKTTTSRTRPTSLIEQTGAFVEETPKPTPKRSCCQGTTYI